MNILLLPPYTYVYPILRYLVADYSLSCDDAEWKQMLPFAILMVVFFVFGVPLFLAILLVRHRTVIKKLGRDIDETLAEAAVLEQLGESIDVDKARALYRQVDTDGSGSIDFVEFAKFWISQNDGEDDGTSGSGLADIVRLMTLSKDSPKNVESLGHQALGLMSARAGRQSIRRNVTVDDNTHTFASTETKGDGGRSTEAKTAEASTNGPDEAMHAANEGMGDFDHHVKGGARRGGGMEVEDGVEMMLGVLWRNYKPEYYFFDIVNFTFKLVLWATLVFFNYGSQLQIGTALLLCVGRLALHAQFEPYRMVTDNAFDCKVIAASYLPRPHVSPTHCTHHGTSPHTIAFMPPHHNDRSYLKILRCRNGRSES